MQGRIQKSQKGVAGTLNSSILNTFYFSETEFYKNNTNFQGKRVAAAPSAHRPYIRPCYVLLTQFLACHFINDSETHLIMAASTTDEEPW